MHAGVHTEMAFQVIKDYPNPDLFNFLMAGMAKQGTGETEATKTQWMKEWMDAPDEEHHSSKMQNDHSYKIQKTSNGFQIKFIDDCENQATVIARLKYAARDINEWEVEEEYRVCAIELAKSIHWVVDMSTPPHTIVGWDNDTHSKIENHFDKRWKDFYDKSVIKWNRKTEIDDIYKWAKGFVEKNYDRNLKLLEMYNSKGSILKEAGQALGKEVILEVAQNLADYFALLEKNLNLKKMLNTLKGS
jgi:hypothetical protein